MDNVPDFDEILADSQGQQDRIMGWLRYYKRQRVIITTTTPAAIHAICQEIGVDGKDVVFAVSAPLTFLHLKDFEKALGRAVIRFCFLNDGSVLTEACTGLGSINYELAFTEIVKRVTGVNVDEMVPPVPETDLLSEEEELKLADKTDHFKERLQLWIDKFQKLAAVRLARFYDDSDVSSRLVMIEVNASYPNLDEENIDGFTLNIGNKVENPEWSRDGEFSQVYRDWRENTNLSTYEELYHALVELSNLYVEVPQI